MASDNDSVTSTSDSSESHYSESDSRSSGNETDPPTSSHQGEIRQEVQSPTQEESPQKSPTTDKESLADKEIHLAELSNKKDRPQLGISEEEEVILNKKGRSE